MCGKTGPASLISFYFTFATSSWSDCLAPFLGEEKFRRHHPVEQFSAPKMSWLSTELNGLQGKEKARKTQVSRTSAERNAPHWEAPHGPPGGHFRAEEASPENLISDRLIA